MKWIISHSMMIVGACEVLRMSTGGGIFHLFALRYSPWTPSLWSHNGLCGFFCCVV